MTLKMYPLSFDHLLYSVMEVFSMFIGLEIKQQHFKDIHNINSVHNYSFFVCAYGSQLALKAA